jgi:hypothetical protein
MLNHTPYNYNYYKYYEYNQYYKYYQYYKHKYHKFIGNKKISCHQLKILGERLLKNSKLKECIAFIWGRVHTNQDGTWMEPVPNVHGKHQRGTRGGIRTRSWDARVSNCKYLNMNCAKMPEYK